MTTSMRIRLWARQAPRAQVISTAVAVLSVLALLTATIRPDGGAVNSGLATSRAGTQTSQRSGGQGGPTSVVGAGDGSGGQAIAVGVGSTGSAGGRAGGSSAGTGGTAGGSVAEAPAASERGVTADSIKVGFTISRTGGISATGFALGLRTDQQQVLEALVAWANNNGGVQGRTINPVFAEEDPTSDATWRPTCIKMTEDEKVFAVLSPSSHLGVGNLCYIEHQVPHLDPSVTISDSMFQKGAGLLVMTGASGNRAAVNWAATMLQEGAIGPGKGKLGLLTDECPLDVEVWEHDLKPFLEQSGVAFAEARLSCDIGASQQQVPAAVLQLRNAGVDRVFLGVIFTSAQTFMQQAQAQVWKPTYLASDIWANNTDFLSKNFPPDQFDRTRATAFSHTGEEKAGIPYGEVVTKCNEILNAAGLPPITDQMGKDAEIASDCDNFLLFLKIMAKVPVNFTTADWVASVEQLGAIKGGYGEDAVFGPGKYDGGDTYALVEWHRECTCWIQIRGYQPGQV